MPRVHYSADLTCQLTRVCREWSLMIALGCSFADQQHYHPHRFFKEFAIYYGRVRAWIVSVRSKPQIQKLTDPARKSKSSTRGGNIVTSRWDAGTIKCKAVLQ